MYLEEHMPKKTTPGEVTDVTPKTPQGEQPAAAPQAGQGLEALEHEAARIEGEGQAAQQQQQQKQEQQQTDTLRHDLADALDMAATMAEPAMWWLTTEEFERYWGKKVRAAIAESGAEIMRRNGLSMGDVMGKWGPYIGLAGALGPSAVATVAAFKRKKKELLQHEAGGTDGAAKTG